MTQKKLLVTGATGSAGKFIVPKLLESGYAVRGQYRSQAGDDARLEWVRFDFAKDTQYERLVDGCSGVVHLAAELERADLMPQVNENATRTLAQASAAAGCTYFGFASSVVVYGSPKSAEVTEQTPLIDLALPLQPQYYAEPYMLAYARSKVRGEELLQEFASEMHIDCFRPAVVADHEKLLESRYWSLARRIFALYRKTQYIHADDAAAAIAFLVGRGFAGPETGFEGWNICDEACGTFRELHKAAFAKTGHQDFSDPFDIPFVADLLKNSVVAKRPAFRKSLGMLNISNQKLRDAGFNLSIGVPAAVEMAVEGLG